jgi:Na+/H+ antiporter NhaC
MALNALESLLPILVAIGLALLTRRVFISLGLGLWAGCLVAKDWNLLEGTAHLATPVLTDVVFDLDKLKVISFTIMIAAMIPVLTRSGAIRSLLQLIMDRARSRRDGQAVTWCAGLVIFFDDYANCLVVGNTLRPLVDRYRISREKLAYLVDTTAAPMATLALISTWIGFELMCIQGGLDAIGSDRDAYGLFVAGIPYRFYPIFALVFAASIAWTGRDFGPMAAAELRALQREAIPSLEPPPAHGLLVALVPLGGLILVTLGSLIFLSWKGNPEATTLIELIDGRHAYDAILHGAAAGLVLALILSTALTEMRLVEGLESALGVGKIIAPAIGVLILAWGLGGVIGELETAELLAPLIGDHLQLWMLPSAVFLASAAMAFATGTSFGTMGPLLPLVIPLTVEMGGSDSQLLAASSSVLAGAVWGDHCSPISDTTVLSSTGAGCDHAEHVATQLPYALVTGVVALLLGTLPAGLGVSPWICLILGSLACIVLVRVLGKQPQESPPAGPPGRSKSPASSRFK